MFECKNAKCGLYPNAWVFEIVIIKKYKI